MLFQRLTLWCVPGTASLGSLDPSLYRTVDTDDDYDIPANHIGRIWFAVEYERELERLLVTVIKAKNLGCSEYRPNERDCYVRYM